MLVKLRASDLQQIYSARLFGNCKSWPVAVKVAPSGEAAISLWTLDRFPTRCGSGADVVLRLSADGSMVLFSTLLDMCGQGAPIAYGADGAIYAGVPSTAAGVLRIPRTPTGGPYVQEVFNSFSGGNGFATPGVLLTILGQDLSFKSIDLSLSHSGALPTGLGGTRVLFDGTPAEILQVAPYRVICVVPADVSGKISVTVKVVNGPLTTVPFVLLNLLGSDLGLWTRVFPGLPHGSVDGVIRNADGTPNSAEHPAAPGSRVTLFATGLVAPGDVNLLWDAPAPERFIQYSFLTGTARRMYGFMANVVTATGFRATRRDGSRRLVIAKTGGCHHICLPPTPSPERPLD